eukprot:gene29600-36883_t
MVTSGHKTDYSTFCFGVTPCSGAGVCDRGFCHCYEGYWGPDCAYSLPGVSKDTIES